MLGEVNSNDMIVKGGDRLSVTKAFDLNAKWQLALCEQRGCHSRTYVYGEDAFVPLARIDSVVGNDGASSAEVRHLHTDHLGTPRELTNSDGRVVWDALYRAWGNVLRDVQEQPVATPTTEATSLLDDAQPIRFQGQYFDNETGLHYNRFRYYDPDVGRYVSIDPLGLTGDTNPYRYTTNPLNWVDPLGLLPCKDDGAAHQGTPKLPATTQTITPPPQAPVIPPDWVSRPGRNGGEVFYPPGTNPAMGEHIRVMPAGLTPVPGYENGYWRWVNNNKQPMDPSTGKPGRGRGDTHVPLPPDSFPPSRGE